MFINTQNEKQFYSLAYADEKEEETPALKSAELNEERGLLIGH